MDPTKGQFVKVVRGDSQHLHAHVPRALAARFRARAAALGISGNRLLTLSIIQTLRLPDVDLHSRLTTQDHDFVELLAAPS